MNENEKKICAICGEEHDVVDMTYVGDRDDYVCQNCLDDNYSFCEHCEEYHPADEAVEVHARTRYGYDVQYWCDVCALDHATVCDDCGERWADSDIIGSGAGPYLCPRCWESGDWVECAECGRIVRYEDTYTDELDYYCHDCWRGREGADAIHEYGYKPAPIFASRQRERDIALLRKYGIELEVDNGDDREETAKAVTEASEGRIYCKRDGSLSDGFEIVTHPATLAYHLYDFRWANIMRICKQNGFKSHDTETCGLHIHVGRQELGATPEERYATASKLVILASALRDELTKFSRRKADRLEHWAAFTSLPGADAMSETELLDYARREALRARYVAVNLMNHATVEFRIFRGTLKRDTLVASLQIVDNLCQYAMTHTAVECLHASFVDVVNVNPTSVLLDYCQTRRIVTRTAV